MLNQNQKGELNKYSIQYGLLIGVISLVLTVVFYLISPTFQYTSYAIPLLLFAIIITLLIVLGLDIRKKIGGYWTFGNAFKSLIIMSVFLVLISTLCNFVTFKFVNPELPSKVAAIMTDKLTDTYTKLGLDQEKVDAALKDANLEGKFQPTLKNELTALIGGLAFYAVIDLIIAAIIKKKEPLFAPPVEEEPTT